MTEMVTFTRKERESLRRSYLKAKKESKTVFIHDGKEYVTQYAYYLLEYLDQQLGTGK